MITGKQDAAESHLMPLSRYAALAVDADEATTSEPDECAAASHIAYSRADAWRAATRNSAKPPDIISYRDELRRRWPMASKLPLDIIDLSDAGFGHDGRCHPTQTFCFLNSRRRYADGSAPIMSRVIR